MKSSSASRTRGELRADFAVLRVPLLPRNSFLGGADVLRAPGACAGGDEALAEALTADRQALRSRLSDLLTDEQVQAAVELASPDLQDGISRWRAHPDSKRGRSAERSLVRYVTRMSARPTPFGIASGYLLAGLRGHPALSVGPREDLCVVSRLDAGLLRDAVNAAASAAARHGSGELWQRRNPLLYRVGRRLRVPVRGEQPNRPRLLAMPVTPGIEAALDAVAGEAMTHAVVAAIKESGASDREARDLVARLLRNELLIPARQVAVTGPPPTAQAVAALAATPGGAALAATVESANRRVRVTARPGRELAVATQEDLAELPTPVTLRRCLQVDSIRSGTVILPARVVSELRRAIRLLARLAPPPADPLVTFKERFESRFGTRSVPLLEALDPDFGIRLEPFEPPRAPLDPAGDAARRTRLLALMERAHLHGDGVVELAPADIRHLGTQPPAPIPPSSAVHCRLAAPDLAAVLAGRFTIVAPSVSPGGARLVGRFCHGDPELTHQVRRHVAAEAAATPDVVLAEVASAPETDWGLNVTHRPVLREWEIECGGLSGAAPERRLAPADLMVGVEAGRVVLHSRSLERRVRPRSSTAMNPEWLALPAARFLALVENQEAATLKWSWGDLMDAAALPRVTSGRIVLTPRRWNVLGEELAEIGAGTDAAGFRALQAWRDRRGIPRLVTFDRGQNPLLVDFGNVLSVDAFLSQAADRDVIRLIETSPLGDSPVHGPDGEYEHELLVAFTSVPPDAAARAPRRRVVAPVSAPEAARQFPPGSEWLFAKLYAPDSAIDRLLTDHIAGLRDLLRDRGLIDGWFFVRYADPDRHLRVRFHGEPDGLLRDALPALRDAVAPALASRDLYRICIDTYEREVERYGGMAGVELMEAAAEADSDAVLDMLRSRPRGIERRHLGVASVAALLADTGLDLAGRHEYSSHLRTIWSQGDPRRVRAALAAEERAGRSRLISVLEALERPDAPAPVRALAARSARLRPVLEALVDLDAVDCLEQPLIDVVGSLAHMFLNRLLRVGGGVEELRVYDALARVYAAELARRREGVAGVR